MTALDWCHAVRDVPTAGLDVTRTATPAERDALAAALGVLEVSAMSATYRLRHRQGGRLTLKGHVEAHVIQECVVTLDPVASVARADLDAVFTPDADPGLPSGDGTLDDLEGPDIEPIDNGTVDIGRIVMEELIGSIDAYPRAPGASLDWSEPQEQALRAHPFSELARLKSGDRGSDGSDKS